MQLAHRRLLHTKLTRPITNMLPLLRRSVRQAPVLATAVVAGGCCLLAATPTGAAANSPRQGSAATGTLRESATGSASATTGTPQESGAGAASATTGTLQESATGSASATTGTLQESATGSPSATTGSPQESGAGSPSAPSTAAPSRERRARREARAEPACDLSLQATASLIAPASPLGFTGSLSCPEDASTAGQTVTPGQTVTLYQKIARTPGFEAVASTGLEADGAFQFLLTGPEHNSVFYVRSGGAKSARARVAITGPRVVIDAPAGGAQLLLGTRHAANTAEAVTEAVTFTGTVTPADPGATVTLQREYRPGKWHRIGIGRVDEEGGFSIPHIFHRPGAANIRVVVHLGRLYANSISPPVTYQISHRRTDGYSSGTSAR